MESTAVAVRREATPADNGADVSPGRRTFPDTAKPPEAEAAASCRAPLCAVLTPGGPLLVDVRLTLDGQPYGAALGSLVKQVLEASDTDKDGRSTWKELAANETFLKGQGPDSQRSGAAQLNEWLDKHDINQNDRIEPDEAASWLGRGAGRTARTFALRTSRASCATAHDVAAVAVARRGLGRAAVERRAVAHARTPVVPRCGRRPGDRVLRIGIVSRSARDHGQHTDADAP